MTHGVHWLPMVDVVVVMVNGKITETGSYDQLITHDGPFAQFLRQYFINEPDTEIENEHPDGKICCWGQLCVNLVLLQLITKNVCLLLLQYCFKKLFSNSVQNKDADVRKGGVCDVRRPDL